MIISHKHRLVFVKTTKTAGTSVEIALSKHCGPDDVITRIHPDDEAIRSENGYPGPQNDLATLPDGTELQLFNHASAHRALRLIGREAWRTWFTFAFERNPFDRTVSAYHYIKANRAAKGGVLDDTLTFDAFVRKPKMLESLHQHGWRLYTLKDKIVVDQVYRYEDIDNAMADIYTRLGISDDSALVKTKVSQRDRCYRDYYDDTSRELVAKVFEKELETFGYAF